MPRAGDSSGRTVSRTSQTATGVGRMLKGRRASYRKPFARRDSSSSQTPSTGDRVAVLTRIEYAASNGK